MPQQVITGLYNIPISAASAAYAPTNTGDVSSIVSSALGDYQTTAGMSAYQETAGMSAYQKKLTAGDNITISNNVIAASQQQANWTEDDSGSVQFIQNKPDNLVQDANYVHTDNDYTNADAAKLAGIEAGAEVNVQANWNQTDTTADDYIIGKPNLALKEDVANKSQTLDPTSTTDYPSSAATAQFVNSSVATNTANFLGNFSLTDLGLTYPATDAQIATALGSHTWPTGVTPTNNDYVYVEIQNPTTTSVDDAVKRFKFNGTVWAYEYTLNNSSFTAAEVDAIDSGINATKVSAYDSHLTNTSNPHSVTKSQVGLGSVVNTGDSATPVSGGTAKFTTGGAYTELAKKVDKVSGMGLSSNDFTTTLKNKLDGIEAGAEVNVQANWNQTDTTADDYIKNKPTIPTVNNATLTIQKNGTNVATFTSNASSNATANITVPTKVSELTNDSGYTTNTGTVTSVKVGSTSYSPSSGVVSLPAYPTVNNATLTIQKNGTNVTTFNANASSNATANITVPTKVSQLTNDSGYTTNTGTVTSVKVGSTSYSPSSGVVSLPAYPTVNNATLTIQRNGLNVATFGANASSNVTADITVPAVNNATLTIQKNGTTVATFGANSATNTTANIAVPTTASDIGASPKTHIHSVKINGYEKTIAATGGAVVDLGWFLEELADSTTSITYDFNDFTTQGIYHIIASSGSTNRPDSGRITLIVLRASNGVITQLAFGYYFKVRKRHQDGTWYSWKQIATIGAN